MRAYVLTGPGKGEVQGVPAPVVGGSLGRASAIGPPTAVVEPIPPAAKPI